MPYRKETHRATIAERISCWRSRRAHRLLSTRSESRKQGSAREAQTQLLPKQLCPMAFSICQQSTLCTFSLHTTESPPWVPYTYHLQSTTLRAGLYTCISERADAPFWTFQEPLNGHQCCSCDTCGRESNHLVSEEAPEEPFCRLDGVKRMLSDHKLDHRWWSKTPPHLLALLPHPPCWPPK